MADTALVYGTLRPGTEELVKIKGFVMHDLGWFPGIIRSENEDDFVVCERIEVVNAEHLNSLDRYEGYSPDAPEYSLYTREKVGDDWIYIYNAQRPLDNKIESGDWLEYRGEDKGTNYHLAFHQQERV